MKNLMKILVVTVVLYSGLIVLATSQSTTAEEIQSIYISLHQSNN